MSARPPWTPLPGVDFAMVAARLRAGAVALFPTETLVGIGCDPHHSAALERLRRIKGRPEAQPYPLLVPDAPAAARLAVLPPAAERLARRLWPGMLTLVLPARPEVPAAWTATDGTIALRVSGHPLAGPLVRALGGPLVATSANRTGAAPPSRMADVDGDLRAEVDLVLPDAGAAAAGAPSTIVRVRPNGAVEILREGAIPASAIQAALEGEA